MTVCSADGKRVPIRGEPKAPVMANPPLKAGPKPGRKKVSLVGSVYTVDPFVRTPEAVLDALFRNPQKTTEPPEDRPQPCFKRVRASLIRECGGNLKALL